MLYSVNQSLTLQSTQREDDTLGNELESELVPMGVNLSKANAWSFGPYAPCCRLRDGRPGGRGGHSPGQVQGGRESVEGEEDGGRRQGRCACHRHCGKDSENFSSHHRHHDMDGIRRPRGYVLRLKRRECKLGLSSEVELRLKRQRVDPTLLVWVKLVLKSRVMRSAHVSNNLGSKHSS